MDDRAQTHHAGRAAPQLYGTPRSHFTRIVRILCHELDLRVRWHDVGNVGSAEEFGGNPLMQVPVFVDGDLSVFGAENVCRYVVERERADPLGVETLDWPSRNLVGVIHGVMDAEVKLILAARCGTSVEGAFFDKARTTVRRGLAWIDERIEGQVGLTYPAVCAVAMWDHLLRYGNVERAAAPRIERVVQRLGEHASVVATRPP